MGIEITKLNYERAVAERGEEMSGKRSEIAREFGKFVQAAWMELPALMAQRILGNGDENALSTAGWKAYDAWVNLTNEAMNRVYENAAVGAVTGRTLESALRMQQVGSTVTTAFLNNLWPALGLPTADQVAGLRSEIAALQEEIGEATANQTRSTTSVSPVKTADDGLKLVRGNGHVKWTDEEKEDAAA
jgi:hypothetical protein